jgi:hypothetical protein
MPVLFYPVIGIGQSKCKLFTACFPFQHNLTFSAFTKIMGEAKKIKTTISLYYFTFTKL